MPPLVQWMTGADGYILNLMDEVGIPLPPTAIALGLREWHGESAPTTNHIARRLRDDLSDHGLVYQPYPDEVRGYYAITELGERYLHDPDAEPAEFIADIDTADEFSGE